MVEETLANMRPIFFRLCHRCQTDDADGGQADCPFIKLHLVPPMLVLVLFFFMHFWVNPVYPASQKRRV